MGAALPPTLAAACERYGPRPAVTHAGRTLAYAELGDRIRALAWAYRAAGIAPGDRIVCRMPLRPELLVAIGAAWGAGAIHVGAHRDLTEPELAALARRVGAAAVLAEDTLTLAPRDGADAGPHRLADLLARSAPRREPPAPDGPADAALLVLTSGTTGEPKAVVETLAALHGKVALFAGALAAGPEDVHLGLLALCHVYGLKLALTALLTGGRLVLLERFGPAEALRLLGEERATILHSTPAHLGLLLGALDPARHRVETLRWATSAAAPLRPALVEEVYARLGAGLFCVYGCSEGFLTVTSDPDDIRRGSAGRTVYRGPEGTAPDGRLAILEPGGERPLPAGEVGEIAYGAAVPVRYWDAPEVALDGWYRTGDLGRLDADGRLYVTGRLKDVVNRGGAKVACGEVEAALAGHPALADSAVAPAPDPVLGEAICACVVPLAGAVPTLAELRAFLGDRLARHKLPDQLCAVEAIPRSSAGKVDRAALAALAAQERRPRERLRA